MVKIITLPKLQRFLTNLRNSMGSSIVRVVYNYTATSTGVQSFQIPSYSTKMIVDVYLNGFLLVPTNEYTISSSGVVTTVNSINSGGVFTFLVTSSG